jgi:small subunit ribosomal protein S14
MAKKSILQRQKKRELLIKKYSDKRLELKKRLKKVVDYNEKLEASFALQKLPKNSSPTRNRKRCWVTSRGRSCTRDFGLSRHILRRMALEGFIPGLTKSS